MKKVILIGDSIRLGYDKYVKQNLNGIAEVYSPEENCKFAEYVLRYVHDWKNLDNWPDDADMVHWNVGLWDVLRLFDDEPLTPITVYGEYIKRIDKRLRQLFPNAKMVFATNTSVVEEGYGSGYAIHFKRFNSEIREYNKVAVEALKDTDTIINDLYVTSEKATQECRSDMTHFNTEKGVKLIGGKVLKTICETLDVDLKNKVNKVEIPDKIDSKKLGY